MSRSRKWRDVRYRPSLPARGEVFTEPRGGRGSVLNPILDGLAGQVPAQSAGIDRHVVAVDRPDPAAGQDALDGEVTAASDVDRQALPGPSRRLQHCPHVPVDRADEHACIVEAVSRAHGPGDADDRANAGYGKEQ